MPDLEPEASSPRQYEFDWRKIGFVQQVSPELLEDVRFLPPGVGNVAIAASRDWMTDMIVMKLRAFVLTHQLAEHSVSRRRTVSWPATPWQHWKHRHAGSWWLRWLVARRPVQMQHEVVDFQEAWTELATYPWQTHLPPFPELGKPNRVVLSDVRWTPPAEVDPDV